MTSDQAAQLIELQGQLLAVYQQLQPLAAQVVRELFPFGAVLSAAVLGGVLGWVAA